MYTEHWVTFSTRDTYTSTKNIYRPPIMINLPLEPRHRSARATSDRLKQRRDAPFRRHTLKVNTNTRNHKQKGGVNKDKREAKTKGGEKRNNERKHKTCTGPQACGAETVPARGAIAARGRPGTVVYYSIG